MSIWDTPCYTVEPLRNTVNNYPRSLLATFPDELSGVANYRFGDCKHSHPERANRLASEFYKENPVEWRKFVNSGKARGKPIQRAQFRSTFEQCNVKYSGLRAVYWAYKAFSKRTWRVEQRIDIEEARAVTKAIFQLNASASRINQGAWDRYFQKAFPEGEREWLSEENVADAVNHLWTLNRQREYRKWNTKKEVIIRRIIKDKILQINCKREEDDQTKETSSKEGRGGEEASIKANFRKGKGGGKEEATAAEGVIESTKEGTRESGKGQGNEDTGVGEIRLANKRIPKKGGATKGGNKKKWMKRVEVKKGNRVEERKKEEIAQKERNNELLYHERVLENIVSEKVGKFNADEVAASYKKVREAIEKGAEVSVNDALRMSIMPYKAYPTKASRLLVFRFEGGYILYDKLSREGGVFYSKDHDRLVQMLKSRAKLTKYYGQYSVDEPEICDVMLRKYRELEDVFFDSYRLDSADWANSVCRAFDVAQFVVLAELASDISLQALEDQWAKVEKEGLGDIININKVIEITSEEELGVKETLELLKYYKIFPCPDFCIYSVVDSLKDKSDNRFKVNWEKKLGKNERTGKKVAIGREEFRRYMMRNRAINFNDVHGRLPGKLKEIDYRLIPDHLLSYPEISVDKLRVDDMDYIDMVGSFEFRRYDGCEDELVKDKSTGVAPDDTYVDMDGNRKEHSFARNQVLQYLFSPRFKSQREVEELFESDKIDEYLDINLALKPEAKKPGSRVFSMATDVARRGLSEFEKNIATYVTKQKGSSQGKSDMDLKAKLNVLSAPCDELLMTFMMSFDLEGFSSKQAPDFKELGFDVWSECFGEPKLKNLKKIFDRGRVRFEKFDVNDELQLTGDDLEGFCGRMNTATHLDVMGYCVYKLKELGLISQSADLEVLIDDGLLRLTVDEFAAARRGVYEKCVDVIAEIYMAAGLKISWDKTFVSQLMCQYLNRVFYDGVEVTPGAKAFLRIGKPSNSAVPCLPDEVASLSASARGAIKSGSDHRLVFLSYSFEMYMLLRKWSGYRKDMGNVPGLAFMCYVPTGLGGLGLSTLAGLSTNESYVSIQTGIATMKMICHAFPGFASLANFILNSEMRDMTAEGILRAPHAIRTTFRTLNTRRFANAAKVAVTKKAVNPVFNAIVQANIEGNNDFAVLTMERARVINEVQRQRLLKISTLSYVDKIVGKLQTSGTAARVVGETRCAAIAMVNRSEAKALINEICEGRFSRRVR